MRARFGCVDRLKIASVSLTLWLLTSSCLTRKFRSRPAITFLLQSSALSQQSCLGSTDSPPLLNSAPYLHSTVTVRKLPTGTERRRNHKCAAASHQDLVGDWQPLEQIGKFSLKEKRNVSVGSRESLNQQEECDGSRLIIHITETDLQAGL